MSQENLRQEPETFIIQNVTRGPHVISDMKLTLEPYQVMDLTWDDPSIVKRSKNLQESLRVGYVKKLTLAQYEKHLEQQELRDRKELTRQKEQEQQNLRTMNIRGKNVDVDTFDTEKNAKKQSAGLADVNMDYVVALDIAQADAELNGDTLTAIEFAELVENDPGLIGRLIKSQNGSTSGNLRPARAYYSEVGNTFAEGAQIKETVMQKKMQRDALFVDDKPRSDDVVFDNFATDEELGGLGEEIDLGQDIRQTKRI